MNTYISGSLVRSSAAFLDASGAATDPTAIVMKWRTGAGSTTTVTYPTAPIIKDSAGNYHADFDTTGWTGPNPLEYFVQWTGTGTVQAIDADVWEVTPPQL